MALVTMGEGVDRVVGLDVVAEERPAQEVIQVRGERAVRGFRSALPGAGHEEAVRDRVDLLAVVMEMPPVLPVPLREVVDHARALRHHERGQHDRDSDAHGRRGRTGRPGGGAGEESRRDMGRQLDCRARQ